MPPFCTLLVDDSAEFLVSATRFLSTEPEIDVVGHARSGAGALEQVSELRPDLVLIDLIMPEMDGLEATRCIKALPEPPFVVILTLHDNAEYRAAAVAAGADGFVAKADFGTQLHGLVRALFAGVPGPASAEKAD